MAAQVESEKSSIFLSVRVLMVGYKNGIICQISYLVQMFAYN